MAKKKTSIGEGGKEQEKKATKEKTAEVMEMTDSEFNSVIKENDFAVVDFFAEWCMPCVIMVPVIDDLAKFFAGKAVFAKIDVDESKKTASEYKIMSIPTLLIFKRGNLVDRITGTVSYDVLKEKIQNHLKEN